MRSFCIALASCLLLLPCRGQDAGGFKGLTEVLDRERQITSVIVSRNGTVVYEYHLPGNDDGTVHNFYSVAKSVTSLIAGIAIDEGYVKGDDVFISDYFPGILREKTAKKDIRLRHLLSMTSGLSWPETTAWNNFFRPMIDSDNWIDFILARDMSDQPGTRFNYNSGSHHVVSKIIQDATGKNMLDFGKARLFDRLGMTSVSWYDDPQGVCFGGAWVRMTSRDALKLGQLVLDRGRFGDRQIVSARWIDAMTSRQSGGQRWDDYVGGEYGYGWWINGYHGKKTVFAWGANEQYIFVTPELGLVAVFTSTFANRYATRPPYLYAEYIVGDIVKK